MYARTGIKLNNFVTPDYQNCVRIILRNSSCTLLFRSIPTIRVQILCRYYHIIILFKRIGIL